MTGLLETGPVTDHQPGTGSALIDRWFAGRGWTAFPFERGAWSEYHVGQSGVIAVPTGAGKTYAAYLAPLAELLASPASGLAILYLTPLRAVARDIEQALRLPVTELGLDVSVESRTGDTGSAQRPSPLGLPLLVDRFGSRLSTEKLIDRVNKIVAAYRKQFAPSLSN